MSKQKTETTNKAVTKEKDTPEKTAVEKLPNDDVRELAAAMNRLADAIHETNKLVAEARREDPNWKTMPTTLTDIARQIRLLCSRLT